MQTHYSCIVSKREVAWSFLSICTSIRSEVWVLTHEWQEWKQREMTLLFKIAFVVYIGSAGLLVCALDGKGWVSRLITRLQSRAKSFWFWAKGKPKALWVLAQSHRSDLSWVLDGKWIVIRSDCKAKCKALNSSAVDAVERELRAVNHQMQCRS